MATNNSKLSTNGIDRADSKNLVEVKGYKKANKNLLKKVSLAVGSILLALVILLSLKCCNGNTLSEEPTPTPGVTQGVGTSKPSPKPSNTPSNTPGSTPSDTPSTTTPTPSTEPTPSKEPQTPQEVQDSWDTGVIPDDEKVEIDDYDDLKDDSKLTRAEEAYIQEYVDYYGISWEDAKATYFAYGPLCLNNGNGTSYEEPTYENVYSFDAEDEAAIAALITELGMSRSEAEEYYATVIAPALGKAIDTTAVKLTK